MDGGSLARLEIKGFNKTDKTRVRMFEWELITPTACLIFSYIGIKGGRGEGQSTYNVETNKGMLYYISSVKIFSSDKLPC